MARIDADELHFQQQDFLIFQKFLQDACGILLGENKHYLVTNRVRRILLAEGIDTLQELVNKIEQHPNGGLRENIINAMTTNETFWFRDLAPFELLKEYVLPELLRKQNREPLRIWSAACSSGQEPFSLSMAISEFKLANLGLMKSEPAIIATDISSTMLSYAREGIYDRLAVGRGLSPKRLKSFFNELSAEAFQVRPDIAARVEFRFLNLLQSYGLLGRFDIVFCRNVLIYFSAELKSDILRRMHGVMKKGSFLFLGSSESMSADLADRYEIQQVGSGSSVFITL